MTFKRKRAILAALLIVMAAIGSLGQSDKNLGSTKQGPERLQKVHDQSDQQRAVAGQPDASYRLIDTVKSPRRTFEVEYYESTNKWSAQVWIATKGATNRSLLFEYSDPEGISDLVSADDRWLVLNHREGSGSSRPILFRRGSDGHFKRTKVDLDSIVWKAAAEKQGFAADAPFDHSYSEVVCWLGNSHSLLLRAHGNLSGEYYLDDWFCIYDADTGKTSLDLNRLNKDAFQQLRQSQKTKINAKK